MKILSGLYEHSVWQRNRDNVSEQKIEGIVSPGVPLHCAVRGEAYEQICPEIIPSADGRFSICVSGVPVGGPYTVQFSAGEEQLTVSDILVGDVWLLAGQSNMQGVASLEGEPPAVDQVRSFGLDLQWRTAHGRLHDRTKAVFQSYAKAMYLMAGGKEPVLSPNYPHVGVGPGTAFGQWFYRRTGVPQGLLATALGGTSMYFWNPAEKTKGPDESLYAALIESVRLNGGKVAGMFWYQGCSDANKDYGSNTTKYTEATTAFFHAVRDDLNSPDLPVVMVQIAGCLGGPWAEVDLRWSSIREQERLFQSLEKRIAVVPACDLSYEDGIHLDTASQYTLGRRSAEAMAFLCGYPDTPGMPIELDSIRYRLNEKFNMMEIDVSYRNVSGNLTSHGVRAAGFSTVREDGSRTYCINSVILNGNTVTLRMPWTNEKLPENEKLAYAYGLGCYANITDEAGRSLPAFGPLAI